MVAAVREIDELVGVFEYPQLQHASDYLERLQSKEFGQFFHLDVIGHEILLPGSQGSSKSLAVSLGGLGGGCGGPPAEAGCVSGTLSGDGVNSYPLTMS